MVLNFGESAKKTVSFVLIYRGPPAQSPVVVGRWPSCPPRPKRRRPGNRTRARLWGRPIVKMNGKTGEIYPDRPDSSLSYLQNRIPYNSIQCLKALLCLRGLTGARARTKEGIGRVKCDWSELRATGKGLCQLLPRRLRVFGHLLRGAS